MTPRWEISIIKWFLFAILAFGLLVFILFFEAAYSNNFYPGVVIGGESVGGKTYQEVLKHFKEKADGLAQNGLELSFEGENKKRELKIPMATAGLTSDRLVEYFSLGDWEEVIRQAYNWGRTGSPLRRLKEQTALVFEKNFSFSATPHEEAIQSLLSRELKNFFREAVPAQFFLNGNEIAISPEKIGESVSSKEILGAIGKNLVSFDAAPLNFQAESEIPLTTLIKLEPFLKLANELARSTKLVFYYQDYRWRVSGRTIAAWLTLKKENEIGVDNKKLENFLSKTVAPLIDNPPQNSRFEMRNGRLVEIVPGKSGNVVDVKKTAEKVEQIVSNVQKSFAVTPNFLLALASISSEINFKAKTGTIEIPIEITQAEPKITQKTIDQYEIKDLVGFARTNFKGSSSDRQHNIQVGVSKLTGLLIAPGEEFSTVAAIGATTEEEGFVKEFVIKEYKSVKELGGGLCQVATTLFRLGLDAGLPITERVNHRYVVSYYGPGLDATIYGPHPDLRFINDTGNYLLLQGKVEDNALIFELYGQKDGRSVEISEAKLSEEKPAPETKYVSSVEVPAGEVQCSETPRRGITADVTYTVHYPDGESKEQDFHSVYQPWQKICLVGLAQ